MPIIPNLSSKAAGSLFRGSSILPRIFWSPVLPCATYTTSSFFLSFRRPAVLMAALSSRPFSPRAKVVFNATCWCGSWGMGRGKEVTWTNVREHDLDIFRLCGGETMGFIWHPWDDWYIIPDMNGGILYGKCR